jgi:hypothetical protein
MINPMDIVDHAKKIYEARGVEYGGVHDMHGRIAAIASELTRKDLDARDIALVLMAVKLVRLASDRAHLDSYVDLINYTAFACSFAVPADVNRTAPAWVQEAGLEAVGTEVGTSSLQRTDNKEYVPINP